MQNLRVLDKAADTDSAEAKGVGNAKYEGIVQTVDAKCFPLWDETSVRKWIHAGENHQFKSNCVSFEQEKSRKLNAHLLELRFET
ncbi:MAG: hypothetical protein C0507_21740 [Cyanobacteria bacterium PR.3.49]|nr:hypothetical protein [Cyanobacteria bacterium PR.3.49]